MSISVNNARDTNSCCGHVPLVEPIKWCCRQLRTMGTLENAAGNNQCARVASKICLVFLAIITFVPSLLLAALGLCFSCTFAKGPAGPEIPESITPTGVRKRNPTPAVQSPSTPVTAPSAPPAKPVQPTPSPLKPAKPVSPTPAPSKPPLKPAPPKSSSPQPTPRPLVPKPAVPAVKVTRSDLAEFADEDLQFDLPGVAPVEVLASKAIEFFKKPNVAGRRSLELFYEGLGPNASDHQIIDELLNGNQGFHVGEQHDHINPKRFFIDNMAHFKTRGVTTIFFEGFDYRDQNTIDLFLDGTWDENVPEVAKLKILAQGWHHGRQVWEVILAAKKHKIRIVGIDFQSLNIGQGRLLGMNYIAAKVMARELKKFGPKDKYVGYVGAGHVCQYAKDPNLGLSEISQCPALVVNDNLRNPTQRTVTYGNDNSGNFVGTVHVTIFAPT